MIYKDNSTMTCVDQCPLYMYGDYSDMNAKFCAVDCQTGWYSDNSTWTCVTTCPTFPSYYADTSSRTCVDKCRV